MAKIAFIGLGNMGGPMAKNLVGAGHEVRVFDLVEQAMQELQQAGASVAESALQAADNVDFVVSMLPAGKHVEALYVGTKESRGLFSSISTNTVVIDCSTIDSVTASSVQKVAADQGVMMMDAPVSGGVAAAQAGTLAFMCGGSQEAFEKIKPILECMGKNTFHAGGAGAGQLAKACNNMLLAIHMIGSSEALRLGINNGLDPAVLSEIMLASSGRNWSLEVYNPCPDVMENVPASNDYQPGFMVDLMCKDLGLAMDSADSSATGVPMGTLAQDLYLKHAANGNGARDFSSIFEITDSE